MLLPKNGLEYGVSYPSGLWLRYKHLRIQGKEPSRVSGAFQVALSGQRGDRSPYV